ncbi:hypothetical protein [Nocardia terpenica]|uniref:Uncharacterized protein n=1 Tax=Nocardia terpenica TaxID=455432 RepID=A0A164LBX0_9NOCA|nr:hypothetical protein [Nocardia terpenica]KZM72237.1 hypothetical protein AWN90_36800 [Nocardia terpenica]NQE86617.1 hypothetical protein [Nocardia terpenica]
MPGWSLEVQADTGALTEQQQSRLMHGFGRWVMLSHNTATGRTSFGVPVEDAPLREAITETLDTAENVLRSVLADARLVGVQVISAEDRDAELAAAGIFID